MIDTREIKQILAQKLKEEGTYFTPADISVRKTGVDRFRVVIKDYEHIPFSITTETDDYFGNIVYVTEGFDGTTVAYVDSKKGFDFRTAVIYLGYYIGTRF